MTATTFEHLHISLLDSDCDNKATVSWLCDAYEEDENYPVASLEECLREAISDHTCINGLLCPKAVKRWREIVAAVEDEISKYKISDEIKCCGMNQ